jgi:hypothetical protein
LADQLDQAFEQARVSGCELGLVVAVTEHPAGWSRLGGFDGCVHACSSSVQSDAMALCALLSTFMAPLLLTGSEDAVVADSLGDWTHPSAIAVASWKVETRTLTFASRADCRIVETAQALNLAPLWRDGAWSAARELMRQGARNCAGRLPSHPQRKLRVLPR